MVPMQRVLKYHLLLQVCNLKLFVYSLIQHNVNEASTKLQQLYVWSPIPLQFSIMRIAKWEITEQLETFSSF